MNVTARGMICGRSCAPARVPLGGAVEHAAVHVRTAALAWNVLNVSGRPGRDRERGEQVELGHRVELRRPG